MGQITKPVIPLQDNWFLFLSQKS